MYEIQVKDGMARYLDDVEGISLSVPAKNCLGMAAIKPIPPITDPAVYEQIIQNPVSGKRLSEIARERGAKSACIIVSDSSRRVPTDKVSGHLIRELTEAGVPLEGILFIVAIGVHRPATEAEMRSFVGEEFYGKVRIENHTPFDKDGFVYLGDTSYGTPVEVNRRAYECDLHISVGKCEPHEFAGFSGGRKSVLPGISSERTIVINHKPEHLYSECAVPGVLEGNPTHLDMLETAKMFRMDFTVNFVVNDKLEPSAGFAGGLEESHAAAVAYIRQFCNVRLETKPDIIVTTPGVPLNLDFYQSMKPLIALTDVLDEDITVVLYSDCPEGVQSVDMLRPFENTDNLADMEKYLLENYEIQMDHALLLSKIFKKHVKIVVYSPNVSDDVISKMYMVPCKDPEKLMETAYQLCGKEDPKVLFYPQPQKGLPELAK